MVNYVVTDMGCFDDYSDAAPHAKTTRGNGITNFLLHIYQCIISNQTEFVTAKNITKYRLKSLYSRLCFKVIKDFAKYPNFEEARERFNYETGKSKKLHKQTIGLQFYITIPRRVTILHENIIYFNENIAVYKYLNEVSPSDD